MKFIRSLLLLALIAFVAWPYYQIYRIDDALGKEDLEELAPLVDLDALRAGTRNRLDSSLQAATGRPEEGSILDWVQDNLRELGDDAVDQMISLEWVRDTLREAAVNASAEPPYYFMRGIDYAFFDSYDSFVIRLGELDRNPTHVRLRLTEAGWLISGIYN